MIADGTLFLQYNRGTNCSKVLRVESDGKVEPSKLENSSNTLFGKSKNISQQDVFENWRIFLLDHSLILHGSQVKLYRNLGLNFHKSSLVQTLYLSFWRLYDCLIYQSNVARSAKHRCLNKKQITEKGSLLLTSSAWRTIPVSASSWLQFLRLLSRSAMFVRTVLSNTTT